MPEMPGVQPFIEVTVAIGEGTTKRILNEAQITSIDPLENGQVVIGTSDGEKHRVVSHPYEAWQRDYYVRKY